MYKRSTVVSSRFTVFLRTFTHPNPAGRVVLDAVSRLTTSIIKSLKLGRARGCQFNVPFRRDVFNFLFSNCGSSVFVGLESFIIVRILVVFIFVTVILFLKVFVLIFLFICIVQLSLLI